MLGHVNTLFKAPNFEYSTPMSAKNLKISDDHAGRRLDNYLFYVYKSLPKSKIYNMIRKGEIRVNSGRIKPSRKLQLNDEIRIPPYLIDFDANELEIKIPPSRITEYWKSVVFENSDYIVFNKDPELSVHSGSSNQFGLIDIARVAHENKEIDLCHRIDKSTSGCIVLSKNKRFLRIFHDQLKNQEITKKYQAILMGQFKGNRRICSQVSSICNCLCITYVEQQLDKYHLYCILLLTVLSSELNKNVRRLLLEDMHGCVTRLCY